MPVMQMREVRAAGLALGGQPAPLTVQYEERSFPPQSFGGTGDRTDKRAGDDAKPAAVITGYAAVFDSVTQLYAYGDEVYEEVVRPGAFARALRERQDVAAVVEHDWARVVARSGATSATSATNASPSTLELMEDATGLRVVARPPATREAEDLIKNIEHGNIRGMSFRFYPVKTRETVSTQQRDGRAVRVYFRELMDVDISDVSWCVWPAYDATSAGTQMRSLLVGTGESLFQPGGLLGWAPKLHMRRRMTTHAIRAALGE